MFTARSYRRILTAIALVPLLASCAAPTAKAPPPATVTVTAPAEVTPEPAADEPAAPDAEEPEQSFVMPDLVGVNLQLAQDTLQSLDSWVLDQEDASGLSRMQINDSNWYVCQQEPAVGSVMPISTVVTLWSVKLEETCP